MSRITKTNVKNRIEWLNKQLADKTDNNLEYDIISNGSGSYTLVSNIIGTNALHTEIYGSLKEIDKCVEFLRNYLYRTAY